MTVRSRVLNQSQTWHMIDMYLLQTTDMAYRIASSPIVTLILKYFQLLYTDIF